jgi:hypothetical protein
VTFPSVKVQPHWLAALERAAEVMPNCRWVCVAVDNGVEPEIEKEICSEITLALAPFNTAHSWYGYETRLPLDKDYRIAWINHMIAQCQT